MSPEKNKIEWEEFDETKEGVQDTAAEEPAKKKSRKKGGKFDAPKKKSPVKYIVLCLIGLLGIALVTGAILVITGYLTLPFELEFLKPKEDPQVLELRAQVEALTAEKEQLLQQIDSLTGENGVQQEKIEELLALYNEMSESLEYVESGNLEQNKRIMAAYETLITAQDAFLRYDEETVIACVEALMDQRDLFSDNAKNAFYNVMEYMEQPYWKNQD